MRVLKGTNEGNKGKIRGGVGKNGICRSGFRGSLEVSCGWRKPVREGRSKKMRDAASREAAQGVLKYKLMNYRAKHSSPSLINL